LKEKKIKHRERGWKGKKPPREAGKSGGTIYLGGKNLHTP